MSDIGRTTYAAAAAWLSTWKKSRLNWILKIRNTADNVGITHLQGRDTRCVPRYVATRLVVVVVIMCIRIFLS